MTSKSRSPGARRRATPSGTKPAVSESPRNPPSRVLIVDDHGFFANGLTSLINNEDDIEVCGVCSRLDRVKRSVETTDPDLVILDVSVAGENSLGLANELRIERPDLRLMFISSFPGGIVQAHAKDLKPRTVVEKTQDPGTILKAVRRALRR